MTLPTLPLSAETSKPPSRLPGSGTSTGASKWATSGGAPSGIGGFSAAGGPIERPLTAAGEGCSAAPSRSSAPAPGVRLSPLPQPDTAKKARRRVISWLFVFLVIKDSTRVPALMLTRGCCHKKRCRESRGRWASPVALTPMVPSSAQGLALPFRF